ncbi:hypothetical protein HPP92_001925 [Vanilla planifolia]|uniref:Uncharacterized protein n=1 Tax=Vanilla planifolia TaxID=51239 RepID=A0A835S3F0_VANPL|nr:hypothetical protein HPP92_001925 [Vanilla planifolia]
MKKFWMHSTLRHCTCLMMLSKKNLICNLTRLKSIFYFWVVMIPSMVEVVVTSDEDNSNEEEDAIKGFGEAKGQDDYLTWMC